jgi:hypothetical protein
MRSMSISVPAMDRQVARHPLHHEGRTVASSSGGTSVGRAGRTDGLRANRNSRPLTSGSASSSILTPPTAERIAVIITALCSSANDFRSVQDLCRASPFGLSPATFRRWCTSIPGVRPRQILLFARLLRAVVLARKRGTPVAVWLDMDERTYRRLCTGGTGLNVRASAPPSPDDFVRRQRFVPELLTDAVLGLRTRGDGDEV